MDYQSRPQKNIVSFVLRFTQNLWRDADGEPHVSWQGRIQHVQGDEENRFTDMADAIIFMQRYLGQLTIETLQNSSPDRIFSESFNIWRRFAVAYMDMTFQAMSQGMSPSLPFTEKSEPVPEVYQLPASVESSQEEVLLVLREMQTQMQTLTERIESLEHSLEAKQTEETD